jgi:cytochrome P450
MTDTPLGLIDMLTRPDETLAIARKRGPIVETEIGPLAVSHAAVRALAQSDKLRPAFSRTLERFGVSSGPFYDWMSISPLDMEGETHRVWRQLMARTFTPRSVEKLRPFLAEEAARLVDGWLPDGRCELIDAFARKLPAAGLCELIGVPVRDRERFAGWADTVGFGFNMALLANKITEIDTALVALLAYADELIAARRAEPRDDLVTRIAQAVDEEAGLDEQDIRASIAGLVFAGHETTKNQIGWMVAVLSEQPAEWDRVAREPERARDVIEEVLRYRSTAANLGRLALEDVEIAGQPIAAGTSVVASLWSANRDEQAFARAGEFAVDANREGVQVAFGQGAHHCLGAALARAELQEALIALTARIHCPRLEAGAEWSPPIGINGPLRLPIAFERR